MERPHVTICILVYFLKQKPIVTCAPAAEIIRFCTNTTPTAETQDYGCHCASFWDPLVFFFTICLHTNMIYYYQRYSAYRPSTSSWSSFVVVARRSVVARRRHCPSLSSSAIVRRRLSLSSVVIVARRRPRSCSWLFDPLRRWTLF